MQGYINDLLKKYTISKLYESSASDDLFTVLGKIPELTKEKRETFHSIIMTLHYLAKRVRTDVLRRFLGALLEY